MELQIHDGKFYIDGLFANPGHPAREGRLVGVYSDVCAFFDKTLCDVEKNREGFVKNLASWRSSGVNLVTLGLQGPSPFGEYYKKAREQNKSDSITYKSSAFGPDGGLDFAYLENAEGIIRAAGDAGLLVLVDIFSSSGEWVFEDEYAVINGAFNIAGWLLSKGFSNVMANIADVSHTFFKSSVLRGGGPVKILKSLKEYAGDRLILGAGLKSTKNIPENLLCDYIKYSDFVPVYSNIDGAQSNFNTKKMLEDIYLLKKTMGEHGKNTPIIVAKGDDLNEKYSSYGKNNLSEALENGASWCYYDREGFVLLPVDWGAGSSPKKRRFFENILAF